ncbi:uncharacterized protein [Procambarus clarkii]|uniref:uncharacterized protein isoform X2 n=1 Tax=Procambarus clarkii TaxID=6728 RepID=UPI001E6742E3|nr:uncharacterized protein LOC123760005 isoform X2 [Procambarus clarkii]
MVKCMVPSHTQKYQLNPRGDDAEGMCGTTLEPDPRYSACCSNIFRPGRVLRDIIVGFLVVLAVAIVIAVLFVVCFYLLPGNKEGESSLGLEEGAFVGSPVKEKKHPNIINEVEFTDDTRYNVSSDPVLGKVKVGDHEDHHHTGPLPNPEPEPEPEPESESKATPDSKPEPDHVHEGVEMQHGHTHGEGDVGQEHAHKKGDAGQEHMHNAGDVGQEHMHNAGDVGHEHMHKEGDLGHEHMHKEGDVGHEHMHKEGDVGHEHMHKEGDVGHEHMHKEGDMGHEHMHKEGDVGHEHMHKEGDVDQEHAHTEGDVGHEHMHNAGDVSHEHVHNEGDVGHEHVHKEGDAGHEHMHKEGDVGHEHMHNAGDVGHEHMHKEGDVDHEHVHLEGDMGHGHVHKEGDHQHERGHSEQIFELAQVPGEEVDHEVILENKGSDAVFAPSAPHKIDDALVIIPAPSLDTTPASRAESESNATPVFQTTADELREGGGLPPLLDSLAPRHDASVSSSQALPEEQPTENPEENPTVETLKELSFPEGPTEYVESPTLPEAQPELHFPITTEEEAALTTDKPSEESAVTEEASHDTCRPRQLEMCSNLPYSLTAFPNWANDQNEVELHESSLPFFRDVIVRSRCSPRAQEYACAILEPPCSADGTILPPCRTFCRSVASTCQEFVISGVGLSDVFNCERFPDSTDPAVCFDMTNEPCVGREHRCGDGRCVAKRLVCDGRSDCLDHSDEAACPGQLPALGDVVGVRRDSNSIPQLHSPNPSEDFSSTSDYATEEHNIPHEEYPVADYPDYPAARKIPANAEYPITNTGFNPTVVDFSTTDGNSAVSQDFPIANIDYSVDYPDETLSSSGESTDLAEQEVTAGDVQIEPVAGETVQPIEGLPEASQNIAPSGDVTFATTTTEIICDHDKFLCHDSSDCIVLTTVCDGIPQCHDGSDESNCTHIGCNYGDFRCATTDFCIPVSWMCDGADDCHDNSDETNCDTQHPSVTQVSSTGEHLEALAPLGQFPLPGGDFGKTIESRNEFIVNQYDYAELVSENSPHSRDKARELNFDDTIQQEFVPSQAALVGEPTTVESDPNPLSSGEQLQLQSEESELLQQFSGEVPILNEAPPYGQAPNGQRGLPPNQKYSNEKEEFGEQPVNHVSQTEQLSNDHDGLPSSRQSIFSLENPLSNENTDQYSSEENFQYSSLEPTQTGYQTSRPFQTDQLFSNEASITESQELNFDEQSINSRLQAFQEQKSLEETLQTNLGHKLLQNNQKLSSKEKLSNNDSQLRGVQHSSILEHHGDDYQQFPGGQAPQNTVKGAQSKTNEGYLDSKFLVTERERQVTKKESLEESNTKLKDIDLAIPITNFPEENRKSDTPGRMRGSIRFSRTNRPSTQRPSESPYVNSPTSPPPDSESSSSGSFRSRFQQWRSSRFPPSPSYESRQTESFRERQHNSPTVSDKKAVEEEKVTEEGADNIRSSSRLRIPNHRSVGPTRITRVRPTLRTSRISSSSHFFPQEEFLKEGINFDATAEVASTEFDNEPASSALSPVIVQGPHFTLPAQPYSPHSSGSAYRNIQNDGSKTFMPKEESLGDEQQAYDPSSVTYDFERRTGSSSLYYGQESSGFNMPINHSPAYLPYTPNHYLHGNIQK